MVAALAFYFRHIKGVSLINIDVSTMQKDKRPAVVFVDVEGAKI